jgi:hypothetical protein
VIFASISTLESAGIQDSGSSTRSWIGMLMGVSFAAIIVWGTLPLTDNGIMLHTVEHVNI